MKTSQLTIKGQITLPKDVRERFRLRPGDRVAFEPESDGIKVRPVRRTILDWAGSLRSPEPAVSDEAVKQRVRALRAKRGAAILESGPKNRAKNAGKPAPNNGQ